MAFYRQGLKEAGWPALDYDDETILLRYPVRVKNKWELLDKAQEARVEVGSWFESPLHPIKLEDHAIFDYTLGQCPISEQAAEETINLPLHQWMTPEEAQRTLNFVLKNGNPV
jgi:dTDP-4-amino-4,6-dideoxygalactose transaminase